jgi:dephospho-CoA kinase
MSKKKIIGILGGIGSGKSTVAEMFGSLGCKVIDADAMAHAVLDRPDLLSELAARWGPSVRDVRGRADRNRISKIVFSEKQELDFLNQQVHPRVLEQTERMIDLYQADPDAAAIVLDMPLLLEVGWEKKCDFLVFVECSTEKRCHRIAKNAKMDPDQIKNRENFQISLDKKEEKAHYTVNNNSDKSDVAEQVAQIFSSITGSK